MVKNNNKTSNVKKSVKNVVSGKKVSSVKTAKKVTCLIEKKDVKKAIKSGSQNNAPKKQVIRKSVKSEAKTNNVIHDAMIGRRFGGLTVLERAGSGVDGRAVYRCGCDCGTVFLATGTAIRCGRVKSCGCQGGHVRRKHYVSAENLIGALEILNQICMDYSCSQDCPLWESCHNKMKSNMKQFSLNALEEVRKRRE